MSDPYRYFRVEAREITDALALGVLDLEAEDVARGPVIEKLLRKAHTLKGAARVVGQEEIAALAHALEDALAAAATGGPIEALLDRIDAISARVEALGVEGAEIGAAEPGAEAFGAGVDLDTLDLLLEALQAARRHLSALRRAAPKLVFAAALSADLDRLGERAHELRLVPASAMFAQLERAARDTARQLDKRIRFEARGGEHHLDARVLSRVRDALVQVVRNAVDHGIEPARERAALGKPPAGRVALEVTRAGHRVTFTCRDDGRGIDAEAVRRSAGQRSEDAASLIFEPGISTRADVTLVSGRGVGLAVAREIAAELRGAVSVESEPGRGAAFSITVPVSLSSLPVLAVQAGALRASIPLDAVRAVIRIAPGSAVRAGDRELVVAGGAAIPLLRLDRWAGAARDDRAEPRSAVLVVSPAGLAAVGVDRALGREHAIVLPVPIIAGPLPALGAALDDEGTPRPVLDPIALVAAAGVTAPPRAAPLPPARVLVVDDSRTSRTLERSVLEAAGYRVDEAASGEEALEKARVAHYDLFIVDVEMPGMDGLEFIAETRKVKELADIPALVVSSRAAPADRERGAEAGARAYLVKGELVEERFLDLVRELSR